MTSTLRSPLLLAAALVACGAPPVTPVDAGFDAGPPPVLCGGPAACRMQGLDMACRSGTCQARVPCGDDYECGLGERCVGGNCRFTGCASDADCGSGRCLLDTFTCAECGSNDDCPRDNPVCDTRSNQCVKCVRDSECVSPGPGYCSERGTCVFCKADRNCPPGLRCGPTGLCEGAVEGQACAGATGNLCAPGLVCAGSRCARTCSLYSPTACSVNESCVSVRRLLDRSANPTAVSIMSFDDEGPLGVCLARAGGGVGDVCQGTRLSGNCQGNLECFQDRPAQSTCKSLCNPNASGTCPVGQSCISFVGDRGGRLYGMCLAADAGIGASCTSESACRADRACRPLDVPNSTLQFDGVCQVPVGDKPGLAACTPFDAGAGLGSFYGDPSECRSGLCASTSVGGTPFFCFEPCATTADCSDGGRQARCLGIFNNAFRFSDIDGITTLAGIPGCVPTCRGASDCAPYRDAGVGCLVDSFPSFDSTVRGLTGSCGQQRLDAGLGGAPCTSALQCASNVCINRDTRGLPFLSPGTCFGECQAPADCAANATFKTTCQPTAFFVAIGPDSTIGSADDILETRTACSGVDCAIDEDCRVTLPDGGPAPAAASCVPVPGPDGGTRLQCRPNSTATLRGGQTCTTGSQCRSGVCVQVADGGTARFCFEACTASSTCSVTSADGGNFPCRPGAVQSTVGATTVVLDACLP